MTIKKGSDKTLYIMYNSIEWIYVLWFLKVYKKGKTYIMINKAFEIVNKKVEAVLSEQGFTRQNVPSTASDELVSLYTNTDTAYSIVYYKSKKHMVMRSCAMTDDGPDNEWKTMGTWIFDPALDREKEAESIGNDFAETLSGPGFIAQTRQQKKKKKNSEDGNGDPLFFAKRLVNLFPELKDEIRQEEDSYESFRAVTFAREHIVPKVHKVLEGGDEKQIDKLAELLSAQYGYCDLDTRSIITIVILNSVTDEAQKEAIQAEMSYDLQKAWKAAEKFRGKKVKPAKKKKKKQSFMQKMMAESIEQQNALNNR